MFEYHLPCVMFVNDETTAMGEERMFKSVANRCIPADLDNPRIDAYRCERGWLDMRASAYERGELLDNSSEDQPGSANLQLLQDIVDAGAIELISAKHPVVASTAAAAVKHGLIQPAYRPWMIPPKPEALYDHAWGAYATIDADDIEMEQWSKRERMRADAYDALANRNRHRVFS